VKVIRVLVDVAFVVAMAVDRTLHRARRLARVLLPRRRPPPEIIEIDCEPEAEPILLRPRLRRRRETIPPPPGKPPSEPPPGAAS